MKRTDLHRPSAIIPEDYRMVAVDYQGGLLGESQAFAPDRHVFREWMKRTGAKFAHIEREGWGCDICGAKCSYIARFHHIPTNTVITTGWDCAAKMEIGEPEAFKSFKKKAQGELKTARGKAKAKRLLAERGLEAAWTIFSVPDYTTLPRSTKRGMEDCVAYEESTIIDIVRKVVAWGSLSDPQAGFIASLLERIPERGARHAEQVTKRAADAAIAKPIPATTERMEVVGTILMTRMDETQFGTVEKCLIQHADGWKVWGSCPIGGKGDVVAFMARVQVKEGDNKFGFFSRPTKARIVTASPETQAELKKAQESVEHAA